MPIYSRKAKYEELRKSLQNDSEAGLQTPELSPYVERLNKVAPGTFEAPEVQAPETLPPVQPRRAATYQPSEPAVQPVKNEEQPVQASGYSKQFFQNGANYTNTFNNEYMNEYVQEAKRYNIEQGNAFSANTDLDILRNLRGEKPKAPTKPYPDEEPAVIKPISQNMDVRKEPSREQQARPSVKDNDTADISFSSRPSSKKSKSWEEDMFLPDPDDEMTEEEDFIDDPRTRTKDDIAAEVRRMIDNQQKPSDSSVRPRKNKRQDDDDDEYYSAGRQTREQQLINETAMIRTQIGEYEDNLNDVNDKMHRTNQILNIVLIILIIALALVLAVVIYWVLLSKGVIS